MVELAAAPQRSELELPVPGALKQDEHQYQKAISKVKRVSRTKAEIDQEGDSQEKERIEPLHGIIPAEPVDQSFFGRPSLQFLLTGWSSANLQKKVRLESILHYFVAIGVQVVLLLYTLILRKHVSSRFLQRFRCTFYHTTKSRPFLHFPRKVVCRKAPGDGSLKNVPLQQVA